MNVLVTGAAGFIGAAIAQRLLADGHDVTGLDNFNDYYDVALKRDRVARLSAQDRFSLVEIDVANAEAMARLFEKGRFDSVVHMAAQAGVRYSLENPSAYVDANVQGFTSVLECCRQHPVNHLVYASASSVYGANQAMPFSEHHAVNHPVSLYAATKKANELMAHTYSHLFGIPTTGLRFFTVYGPWGRPDMALFKFTRQILAGEPIDVYGYGEQSRDFTYIDDIVEGVLRVLERPARPDSLWDARQPDPASGAVPYKLYNIGSNNPQPLMRYIEVLEQALGVEAKKNMLPMQPGDVANTYADVSDLINDTGYQPGTTIEAGVARFVDWYRGYYGV